MTGALVNDFPTPDGHGDFLTMDHHRVLGSLSRPRSVNDLVDCLARNELAKTSGKARTLTGARELLADLEAHGLVAQLARPSGDTPADAALDVIQITADNPDVPDMPAEEHDAYVLRAQRPDIHPNPHHDSDLWYWTTLGRAKLMAPAVMKRPNPETGDMELVPDTRELAGAELAAAQKALERFHDRNRKVTAENLKQARDAAQRHLADLDEQINAAEGDGDQETS